MLYRLVSLTFYFLLCLLPTIASAKVYLVSAGISNYPNPSLVLTNPANDAIVIDNIYNANGNCTSRLLTESDATRANILDAISTVFANARPDDIVVFFFSGHGYPGGFLAYDGKITYTAIRQAMGACRSKNKMIFADACYAGKMRQGGKKVTRENKRSTVMLFMSSRDNETSIERRDMENGFFTTCLRDALKGKADADHNRVITARELFNYVSRNVKRLSGDRQHPVMWGNFPNDMPVIQW